jgi:hypothetical protein
VTELPTVVKAVRRVVGLQLLENSTATVFGLAVLILMLNPVAVQAMPEAPQERPGFGYGRELFGLKRRLNQT